METEKELNAKIMAITMRILENYPELAKFLNEMPITIPDVNSPEISSEILHEYYQSLSNILKGYTEYSTALHAGKRETVFHRPN